MSKFRSIVRIAVVPALLLAASPAFAQVNVNFSQNSRNGVCYFSVGGPNAPGTDKPMTLEFSYRVRDGNLGASIKVNGWERVQKANPDTTYPMTVVLDTGKSKPSRSGGYQSGFNDTIWAGWGPGELSTPLLDLLKGAKTARVEVDGMKLGPFDLQMKGLAYVSLTQCAERVRAGKE
ncbi:hypothetical protein OF829_18390 [Sphingomonas sp. LB-2]|uniref:hypothetical protein n=1 Tax=Sphingomonas caeni TaxID=2984949 RepID=UPI00222F4D6A|nr:hypothetical protein [Sphingomonas caeni]MCW3849211.1 hypothetical protein [Sphingomonas caeni]